MNPLVKCPRCDGYTNPEPIEEYQQRTEHLSPHPDGNKPGVLVCEYCGWKLSPKVTA